MSNAWKHQALEICDAEIVLAVAEARESEEAAYQEALAKYRGSLMVMRHMIDSTLSMLPEAPEPPPPLPEKSAGFKYYPDGDSPPEPAPAAFSGAAGHIQESWRSGA